MIAAGSLFTSCVENTEPAGIKDLREAKAGYLDALANLRAADAEKVKAEATLVQAKAATEQARAALQQAKAKEQELINNKKEADDEIAIQKARKDAEVYLAQQEQVLAKAEEDLRAYLVKVEEQSKQLTTAEYQIVVAYTTAYNTVVDKQKGVRDAEAYLYSVTYTDKGVQSVEAQKAVYEQQIADNEAIVALNQAKYDEWSSVAEDQITKYDFWAAEYKKLQDSINDYGYDIAEIQRDSAVAALENKEAIDKFFGDLEKIQTKVEKVVNDAKTGFSMEYVRAKQNAFKLPDETAPVVTTFKTAVNAIDNANRISVDPAVVGETTNARVLSIAITGANAKDVAESFIFGDEENPDAASLAGIIDALKRDSVVVDKLVKDTAGLGAAVAAVKAEYEAVKDTLVKGVGAYKPIADAEAKVVEAEDALDAAKEAFTADSTKLLSALNDFVKVWNEHADGKDLDKNDSTAVWEAFMDVMKAREALPYKGDLKKYYYYKPGVSEDGTKIIAVKDSALFSALAFSGIQVNSTTNRSLFGGKVKDDGGFESGNAMRQILKQAFGISFKNKWNGNYENANLSPIDSIWFYDQTGGYRTGLFQSYWITDKGEIDGAKWDETAGKYVGTGKYVPDAVTTAEEAVNTAKGKVTEAKDNYYKNIYCKFWGLLPTYVYDVENHKLVANHDSLKINYSEKTYTDPYVIPVFSADDESKAIFTPAKATAGKFEWDNIKYNTNNKELKLIEEKLGNNIKLHNYTLYAKTLAAEQIAALIENYKENTQALKEIEEAVAAVELAYAAAVLKVADAEAAADSVVTVYLGEDFVKKAIDAKDAKSARGIWNSINWQKYIVNVKATDKLKDFTRDFCEAGKYKLGGQQLATAEANIPHYAEVVAEHNKAKAAIATAQNNCTNLSEILKTYVDAVAKVEGLTTTDDPEKVAATVKNYFTNMLQGIQGTINTAKDAIAVAEGSIKKLEAGYDTTQVTIDYANDLLAKAQQALEQAEVEFAVAEAAYKAVLANHDITE